MENEDTIKIWAPLINGEQWLRENVSFMEGIQGPFSSGYGGCLYATISRKNAIAAYKKARGSNREFIKEVCKLQ